MKGKKPLREDLIVGTCLEVYGSVRHEGRLADRALEFVLRKAKHLYSQERRVVAERVYSLLRRQRLVDFLCVSAVRDFEKLSTARQDLFRLGVARVLDGEQPSEVVQAVGLQGQDAGWLKQLDKYRVKLEGMPHAERFAIEASVPDFLAAKLLKEVGDEADAFARAINTRAPLTVRTNTLQVTREELASRLAKEEVVCKPTPLSPFGLFLETRTNVYSLEAFKDGLFEVQDEGSQLLGMLVDPPPRKVVDACAGAGGKTLQLAASMKNRGEVFALDVDERRLEDLKQRARRAGVHNVRVQAIPPGPEALEALAPLMGGAERVLVDAPCSGTGTFRRKPDGRYRLTEVLLADHVERQRTLLARFAQLVKPGGRLIYGTCSLLREENEAVVHEFIEAHPDFELTPATPWLGEEVAAKTTRDGMLRLFPHKHGTDGFFGAVMKRKGKT